MTSTRDTARDAGVRAPLLHQWVRLGYLFPQHPTRSGASFAWPAAEVVFARRIAGLQRLGWPLAVAAYLARDWWPGEYGDPALKAGDPA